MSFIPSDFEQKARINELRDSCGITRYKLDNWLAFQRAIIEYYEPFMNSAGKVMQIQNELELKKAEIERLSQGSLFFDAFPKMKTKEP